MEGSLDLTLESIHGVARRPCGAVGGNDAVPLSAIRAYVSFSGSIPNMKVSSFAMCPEKGSLVVESNTPEIIEISGRDTDVHSLKTQPLNTTFADPFDETRLRQSQSSGNCSSSHSSSSSCRPHLQFALQNDTDARKAVNSEDDRLLKLHIIFRSVEGDAVTVCSEGVSELLLHEDHFESLPLVLDLPITPTKGHDSDLESEIFFEASAYIRLRLDDAMKRQSDESIPSMSSREYILSDYMDEIQLVGMVQKIHRDEQMKKIRDDAGQADFFGTEKGKGKCWSFACGGPGDFKMSLKAFLEGIRGARSKCMDPDQELFTSITMTSTIDTRDSEQVAPHQIATPADMRYEF